MIVEEPAGPDRKPAPCRTSIDAPCDVETRLNASLQAPGVPPAQGAAGGSWRDWFGERSCHPVPAATDAAGGSGPGPESVAASGAACNAAALAASRLGLAEALRLRFHSLAPFSQGSCDLVVQVDADKNLSPDERLALLRIAEESAAQVQREGSRELRVLLRRSRLGSVELSVAGGGGGVVAEQVADSFRSLAQIRRLATQIDARLTVRRLDEGSLLVRCRTRWTDGGTGHWVAPK